MVKAMKRRDVEAALLAHHCGVKSEAGIHTKWVCPCGRHTANIPRGKTTSPGVIRDTVKRMACLPEGWLQ